MQIKDMFRKKIDREIQGVIIVGQGEETNVAQELEEYVVTRELQRHFADFFAAYKKGIQGTTPKMGVWISGFFGSGKSHFLKILSYLLQNKQVGDKHAIDYFIEDQKITNQMVLADMQLAANTPSDVILFNIDSKSDSNGKENKDAIVNVFLKVFNEMQGFCGSMPHLADLERRLSEEGRFEEFKKKFEEEYGDPWESSRQDFDFIQDSVVDVLSDMDFMSESFFGGKRLVLMPLIRPSTYSDKDLQELCDTLADTENAIFVLTSIIEESYGKLRPGKREQKLIASCEKLGYCVQLNRPTGAALQAMARDWAKEAGADFAPGAEAALLARCGEDQFLLKNEVEKLAALANYSTITKEMVSRLGTVTLDADTFDMVKLLTSGQADKAQQKLKTLLALQNEPIMITGALISNYLDLYRVLLGRRSRRGLGDVAKDFGYKGNWNYRLNSTEKTALRFKRAQLEDCLHILQRLDTDLKSSKLDADLLMQKALCELALAGRA